MVKYQLWFLGTCLFPHYMLLQASRPTPKKYLDIHVIQAKGRKYSKKDIYVNKVYQVLYIPLLNQIYPS